MFTASDKTRPITIGFKPRIILSSQFTLVTILLLLILQTLTGNAKSVLDGNSIHSNHHEQHNQLVSSRHQNGGSGENNAKLRQAAVSSGNQNRCQPGWMWVNNKCWVTLQSRRDFSHSIDLCKKMHNATLPTIHSDEENEFLRNNINLQNSPIWLYARHNHQYNKTRWLDKTPVDYTRWDEGQPSDKSSLICIKTEDSWYMKKATPVDGQTECVSFWEDAKWSTNVGCTVLLPVVCEQKLTAVSRMAGAIDDGQGDSMSRLTEQSLSATMSGAPIALTSNLILFISSSLSAVFIIGKSF